jgi:hypothetical protein
MFRLSPRSRSCFKPLHSFAPEPSTKVYRMLPSAIVVRSWHALLSGSSVAPAVGAGVATAGPATFLGTELELGVALEAVGPAPQAEIAAIQTSPAARTGDALRTQRRPCSPRYRLRLIGLDVRGDSCFVKTKMK